MSKWLEQQIQKVDEKRVKYNSEKPKRLVVTAVIFLIFLLAAFIYGTMNPSYDVKTVCGIILSMGIVCELIVFASSKGVNNKPKLPTLQKSLNALLTTPEQTEEFDNEMLAAPLFEMMTYGKTNPLLFTEHYIVSGWESAGEPDYMVFRISDIAGIKYCSSRDQSSASPLARLYDIDICGADGRKIGGLTIHGKKSMQEFQDALARFCPNLR